MGDNVKSIDRKLDNVVIDNQIIMKGIQDLLYKFQDNPNSTLSDVESRIRDAKLNDLKRPEGSLKQVKRAF